MNKKLMKRLLALVLTGGILISSTGVYTALATEETTTSEYTSALVGSTDETTTSAPVTEATTAEESTTEASSSVETTTDETTTASVQKPASATTQEATTKPSYVEEEATTGKIEQLGAADITLNGSGTEQDPYLISTTDEFLVMNKYINDIGNANKHFRITVNSLDFSGYTFDDAYLAEHNSSSGVTQGLNNSLISVNPSISSSNVYFSLDTTGTQVTLENITISSQTAQNLSVIGYMNSSSKIKNITFNNVTVISEYTGAMAAGIILKNEGTVQDCTFTQIDIDISKSSTTAESFFATDDSSLRVYSGAAAAIVDNTGVLDSTTQFDAGVSIISETDIKTGRPYAGAAIAQNRGKLNKVRVRDIVIQGSATASNYVGGLVGTNATSRSSSSTGIYNVEITRLASSSSKGFTITGADRIGGIAGNNTGRIQYAKINGKYKSSSTISETDYSILVNGLSNAGGITGYNTGDIQYCSALNVGAYFADTAEKAVYGGIAGVSTYGIRGCVATGVTDGAGTGSEITRYVGGIVGVIGENATSFSVNNCYALVRILDSKQPLGAIVGWGGDSAYEAGQIKNVYFSSIIANRPSPVSYGAAGTSVGDLSVSKPYAIAFYYTSLGGQKNTVSASATDFSISGWGGTEFEVIGNFTAPVKPTAASFTGSASSMSYYLTASAGTQYKTRVFYEVNITLPSGVGSDQQTILSAEPMEYGILNSSKGLLSEEQKGVGTAELPLYLYDLNLIAYAPAAHFKVADDTTEFPVSTSTYTVSPSTFWGAIDFNGATLTYQSNGAVTTPLFKGVYGSRDNSLTNNDSSNHLSSSADSADVPANLNNGVIKNLTVSLAVGAMSNYFGEICNATFKNVKIQLSDTLTSFAATESNSGLFAKAVYGNSYLYGCYTETGSNNVAYNQSTSYGAVSAFIGTLDADKTIIDNCAAKMSVYAPNGTSNNAVFIGKIKSLDGGYIQNCYAVGGVQASSGSLGRSNNYIFASEIASSSTAIYNCYYSPSVYYSSGSSYNGAVDGIKTGSYTGSCKTWSFVQTDPNNNNNYIDMSMKIAASGEDSAILENPVNIDRYKTSDFGTGITITGVFDVTASNSFITVSSIRRQDDKAVVQFTFSGAQYDSSNLLVTHLETGLVARLSVINSSELKMDNGVYKIETPIDLFYLSENQKSQSNGQYLYVNNETVVIEIAADIDMTGYTIQPIGDLQTPFKGTFKAGTDSNGNYYTVSNLSYSGDFQSFFGALEGAHITGIQLDNINVSNNTSAAVLTNYVYGNATLTDCKVTNSTVSGPRFVGGLIGMISQKASVGTETVITNCTVDNTTIISTETEYKSSYVGGLIGCVDNMEGKATNYAIIEDSTVSNCTITGNGYGVGGIVGLAEHADNEITGCNVISTSITCTSTSVSQQDSGIGGIAGKFSGLLIDSCTVTDATITGNCAAGVTSMLRNAAGTVAVVSNCTVNGDTVISVGSGGTTTIAGGILAAVGPDDGDQTIQNCKLADTVLIKTRVVGGIVGNIGYYTGTLVIDGCTNLATVETTAEKSSSTDGAGGIVGRIASFQDTNCMTISNCLSQGTVKGLSILGGVIGVNLGAARTADSKLISNTHVTSEFESKNLAVSKGIILGYAMSSFDLTKLSENLYYSSLSLNAPLVGGREATADILGSGSVYDFNLGEDQQAGLKIGLSSTITSSTNFLNRYFPYTANAIVGYSDGNENICGENVLGKNYIELKQNFFVGSTEYENYGSQLSYSYNNNGEVTSHTISSGAKLTAVFAPRLGVSNVPVVTDDNNAAFEPIDQDTSTSAVDVFKTDASSSKIIVGSTSTYNKINSVNIQTFDKKCQATVYAIYQGTINGEDVSYKVGFTVIVKGIHAFDGTGTAEDPFIIREAQDLLAIKQHFDNPNDSDLDENGEKSGAKYYAEDTYYEVVNDITDMATTLGENAAFAPIGTKENPFKAKISSSSGQKFVISDISILKAEDYEYAQLSEYGENPTFSDALGVFGYTENAVISDLEFENISISSVPKAENGYLGSKTGAVVGVATNTTISNVSVTGSISINITPATTVISTPVNVGGIVGLAGDSVILSDVSLIGLDNGDGRADISATYAVGGIVGSSEASVGGSITNARVENANITNTAKSGSGFAGGIAGIYTGTVAGSYEQVPKYNESGIPEMDTSGNPVYVTQRTPTVVNNATVSGIVIGGAVGTGSEQKRLSQYTPEHVFECIDITNTLLETNRLADDNVTVNTSTVPNIVAGGILGKTGVYYKYRVEDCKVDSASQINTTYVGGGIVGKIYTNGVSGLASVDSECYIRDCEAFASITQYNAWTADDEKNGIHPSDLRPIGIGGIVGVVDENSRVIRDDYSPQVQITDSTGGGVITGTVNVGGVIGQFATQQAKLPSATESIVSNCVVAATLAEYMNGDISLATDRFGIVLGAVEGNTNSNYNTTDGSLRVPFPEPSETYEYSVAPFDKIFYSSYTAKGVELYGVSEINNYQGVLSDEENGTLNKNDGNYYRYVFSDTVFDLNQISYEFEYSDIKMELSSAIIRSQSDNLTDPKSVYEWYDENKYHFSTDFQEGVFAKNGGTGNLYGFTLAEKTFELESMASANELIFTVGSNEDANKDKYPYKLQCVEIGEADLVYTYTNGIKIGITVSCGINLDGAGDYDDPFIIDREDKFYVLVKLFPNMVFMQTENLDFTDYAQAESLSYVVEDFKGAYFGVDGGNEIKGLNINSTSTSSPVGIFGTISSDPEIVYTDSEGNIVPQLDNIKFVDCKVNNPSPNGNTGVVAGTLTNGAFIRNITVENSNITASAGSAGGVIGTVSDASVIENVTVTDTSVTIASGNAGGVAGAMINSESSIISPVVSNSVIMSGSMNGNDFAGGATSEDIAGGIVAQAFGTIEGKISEIDGELVTEDAVSGTKVRAFYSGGAVGAVYRTSSGETFDNSLLLNNIRVVSTDVDAKAATNDKTGMSAAGLLGVVRNSVSVELKDCYADKNTTVDSTYYAGGAIAYIADRLYTSVKLTDTETYANISVTTQNNGETIAYGGGTIGYIANGDLNLIKMSGCVAGGDVKVSALNAYAGGLIGGYSLDNIIDPITVPEEEGTGFFINGVISATVSASEKRDSGVIVTTNKIRSGKLIANYSDSMFPEDEEEKNASFAAAFSGNYYSSYPQNIRFFASISDDAAGDYENLINQAKADQFVDINVGGNLMVTTAEDKTGWNNVAITSGLDSNTLIHARVEKAELPYGNGKISTVDPEGFTLGESVENPCIYLGEGGITGPDEDGVYSIDARTRAYGAVKLAMEYTCGLATTVSILSVEIKGDGSQANPYLIGTPLQLRVVGYLTEGHKYFKQINDIDLSNSYNETGTDDEIINYNDKLGFEPIGTESSPFTGEYDGQGYKITGMYINRAEHDNVGLFGYTSQTGDSGNVVIKNVHLELMPADAESMKANGIVGRNNVGGIVGFANGAVIENCSVALGSVTGSDIVGGIVGKFSDSQISKCFTQSDVSAFGARGSSAATINAGGIVGRVTSGGNGAFISTSFASGSIYATPRGSGSDLSNAAGIVSYVENVIEANNFEIRDCLFTGTTAGGFGIVAGSGGIMLKYTVKNCIDAGQNIATHDGTGFNKISSPVSGATSTDIAYTNVFFDSALLKTDSTAFTGYSTSKLIDTVTVDMGTEWTKSTGYYPVPVVASLEVTTYNEAGKATGTETLSADPYSSAYAKLLSAPVQISEDEEASDVSDENFGKGIVYPVTLLTKIGENSVIYSSSKLDTTDIVEYPEGYDENLYGDGANRDGKWNKNVDLLFEDIESTGKTSVYRNIFEQTKDLVYKTEGETITKNTRVNTNAASGAVFSNGEAYYNTQVPEIRATVTIDGITVQREIKLPLSYGTTYPIATQRQLYALGMAENETAESGSKFSDYYGPNVNYKLITDIDCTDTDINFNPIGYGKDPYAGEFDGSRHTIKGLKIVVENAEYPVGFFSVVKTDTSTNKKASIKNLALENTTVVGGDMVGTLVGHVEGSNVTIEYCKAIGTIERDADGNIIEEKTVGTVKGSGYAIGGLIGKTDFASDKVSMSNSSVTVYGGTRAQSVGGLIGISNSQIESCYATGDVICDSLANNYFGDADTLVNGVGGLIGVMGSQAGIVTESFASGNVEVKTFGGTSATVTREKNGVGGFVGFVEDNTSLSGNVITECFSGGNVSLGSDDKKVSVSVSTNYEALVGVGGFSGVNFETIANCYSSSAVTTKFGSIANNNPLATFGVGIGGVSGIARASVNNVYSSGSVSSTYDNLSNEDTDIGVGRYYGIGGTVGTDMEKGITFERCYFDRWTNTDPNLKSIGNKDNSTTCKSLTTTELTSGSILDGWDQQTWGFTVNAYPYLKKLLNEKSDNYIMTNAILSVVRVEIDEDDVSAKEGRGVTMALTVPDEFVYVDDEGNSHPYNLIWSGATLNGNLAAINRTRNTAEYVDVVATIKDYEQYATRTYRRACADMKGTYSQPYLIGNETDLAHVNMTTDEYEEALANPAYTEFYAQWVTPLDEGNSPIQGTVYYQLMSNVNVENARNIPQAPSSYTVTVTEYTTDSEGNVIENDVDMEFAYEGFVFNGNAYAIQNVETSGNYFNSLDDKSKITNMIFENITFTEGSNSALVGTNNGEIIDVYVKSTVGDGTKAIENAAGLTLVNNGAIDGCVVDVTMNGAQSNIGIMARNNNGTIKNSATAGTVKTLEKDAVDTLGAFVAVNTGSIESCFSMVDIDVLTQSAEVTNISGFAAKSSGTIDGVYTRSAISFETEPDATETIASLVAVLENSTENAVTDSYSAGLLDYYNESQHSIAFGTAPENLAELDSIYIDKSLTGQASYNSFKYSTSTSNLISMKYMQDMVYLEETNENGEVVVLNNGKFELGADGTLTFPQLHSILSASNTAVIDENQNPIEIEEGTIIRNYDVIKAYSALSAVLIKTANSQYADRLAPNSADLGLDSYLSQVGGISYSTIGTSDSVSVSNADHDMSTTYVPGSATVAAAYNTPVELTRGSKISPTIYIDVAVTAENVINPNFPEGGIGSVESPYIITDAAGLQSLTYYGTDENLYFRLGNDIDMNNYPFEQIPIFASHLNEGVTDAQYAIEDLTSTTGGLFGYVDSSAVINNIAIAGANVSSNDQYTGALADVVNGAVITNCAVSANVTSSYIQDESSGAAATGVLIGMAYGGADISSVITTGNVKAENGAAGGIVGYVFDNTKVHEVVSTANVPALNEAGGIIGTMEGASTLENALYGGVAESCHPIVAVMTESTADEVYYDSQLNSDVVESDVVGTAKKTGECTQIFKDNALFKTSDNSFYPIPSGVAASLENSSSTSFAVTASLAAMTLNFYKGSSYGYLGYYTSMQFASSIAVKGRTYSVSAVEQGATDYFLITQNDGMFAVRVNRYSENQDPTIVISTTNGAERTINPGLVRTANISYVIVDSTGVFPKSTYSVLIKSLQSKDNLDEVDVINDFTTNKGTLEEPNKLDSLLISNSVNGFYVCDMLLAGYTYEISATLNGETVPVTTESGVYGEFVDLSVESQDAESTNVVLTLKVEKTDVPWGVRSQNSTLN